MRSSKKDTAMLFSNGEFEKVHGYLNSEIIWDIVGEEVFEGKESVVQNCHQIASYFQSVDTDFVTNDVIVSEGRVVVVGTAEFKRNGERVNFVSACDVYEFNEEDEITKISSYCITEKN